MTNEQPRYLAYMLRLWKTHSGTESVWRASLENPHTGERQGFANLRALFAFLEERTCDPTLDDNSKLQRSPKEE